MQKKAVSFFPREIAISGLAADIACKFVLRLFLALEFYSLVYTELFKCMRWFE